MDLGVFEDQPVMEDWRCDRKLLWEEFCIIVPTGHCTNGNNRLSQNYFAPLEPQNKHPHSRNVRLQIFKTKDLAFLLLQ